MKTQNTESRIRTERRYWRRTDTLTSWWPWGLLPFLGLVLLFLYGMFRTAPHIQADIESEVAAQLRANAVAVTGVSADGQGVLIQAGAPSDEESRIRAMAKSTGCDTWVGPLTCPTTIELALIAPAAPASSPAPSVTRRTHDFLFIRDDDAVILTGEVPSDAQRRSVVQLADARFEKVIDRLTISNQAATEQYPLAADRALAVLGKFKRGQATWTDDVLEATGLANAEDAEVARSLFHAADGRPTLGGIEIQLAAVAPEAPTQAVLEPAPSPAPAVVRRTHNFLFSKAGSEVILSGEVPSDAERQGIVQIANMHFAKVIDRLSVSNQAATEQYPLAADRALTVLGKFRSGQATWTNAVFEAKGIAKAEDAEVARSLFHATGGKPNLGRIDIQLAEDLRRCNEEFRQALSESTIRFRTGSADIDEGNETLLEQLAKLARECPGNLTVAGHTDNRGDADMNQKLSLARATAVRDALIALGVEAERLTARGLGESEPIFDNDTSEGRASNRRIVISMTN